MTPIDQCLKCKHPWFQHGVDGICHAHLWSTICGCTEKRPAPPSGEQGSLFVKEGEYPE